MLVGRSLLTCWSGRTAVRWQFVQLAKLILFLKGDKTMIRNAVVLVVYVVLWNPLLRAQTAPVATPVQYAGWAAAPGGGPRQPEGAQYGPVIGKPFSATEVRRSAQTLNDGTLVEHSDIGRFYRDGQGRMRAESPNRIEIFDPVARMEYDLNPENKTYRAMPISEKTVSMSVAVVGYHSSTWLSTDRLPDAARHPSSPGRTEDVGTEVVNGILARGSRVTSVIPVGAIGNNREIKIVNERWYSDDLQALVRSSNNDPRFGLNTYELTSIEQGAPDPSLFQPPAGYMLTHRNH
jgi:hypothetical protein